MKPFLAFSIIACLLSLPLSCSDVPHEEVAVEKAITESAKTLSDFPRTREKQSILKFYAKDYVGIQDGQLETLESSEKWLSDLDQQLKLGNPLGILAEVKNIKVHISGTTGWATYEYGFKLGRGGDVVQEERRMCTSIHRKEGNLWLIVHDHCSGQGTALT